MSWIVANIGWIMVVLGLLTCTMLCAAVAPEAAQRAMFGEALLGPLADVIVRNWGALIALVGVMLLYGAYYPASRPLIVAVAGVSKVIFIGLLLTYGRSRLTHQARAAIVVDSVAVIVFAWYLLAARAA